MKKIDYTAEILAERFRARARLAVAWAKHDDTTSPTKMLAHAENDFFATVEWVYGWDASEQAVAMLDKYPLTSRKCPYDLADRKPSSLWLFREEWEVCRADLLALNRWGLASIEPSACDDGIYLAVSCRAEAVPLINRIIDREEV